MNYFKRFVESVSKLLEEDNKTSNNKGYEHVEMATDGEMNLIEIEDAIKSTIVKSLKKLFKGNDTSRLTLKLFVLDNLVFNGLGLESDVEKMKKSLEERIWAELGVRFKTIHISNKKPDGITLYPVIGKGLKEVFYTVEETGDYATVTALKNYGTIIGEKIKMTARPNAIYNIGRGKEVRTKTRMFRSNHIAFDDTENCEDYQINMHVSACHAHIQYKRNLGFVLYVDEGGTRISGKRTRIIRQTEKEPIDLDSNTKNFIPLKDGDIIELGKEALLKYSYT